MLVALPADARAGMPVSPSDPLLAMIHRIDTYLHRHEVEGVTRDPRNLRNPSEEIRLTVVPQLLGYYEMYKLSPRLPYYQDIVARADFLTENFAAIRSGTSFDGMLGYALLAAYEVTGDPRYFEKGDQIVHESLSRHGFTIALNWGLMAGMALAKYHALTGSPPALAKLRGIIGSLAFYQNPDGSFPHYCYTSKDIQYTAWMGMELAIIAKDCDLGSGDFLNGRVAPDGRSTYEEPCGSLCSRFFYSRRSGCPQDYDTRGWINELGYNALLFDRFGEAQYHDVIALLHGLEERGVFADKWDYFPSQDDPIYVWASGSESVIRTSVTFWALATIYADRPNAAPARCEPTVLEEGEPAGAVTWCEAPLQVIWGPADLVAYERRTTGTGPVPEPQPGGLPGDRALHVTEHARTAPSEGSARTLAVRLGPTTPHPVIDQARIRFALDRAGEVRVAIYDLGGRLVRTLVAGEREAGEHEAHWDRLDDLGRRTPGGVYFATLKAAGRVTSTRLVTLP